MAGDLVPKFDSINLTHTYINCNCEVCSVIQQFLEDFCHHRVEVVHTQSHAILSMKYQSHTIYIHLKTVHSFNNFIVIILNSKFLSLLLLSQFKYCTISRIRRVLSDFITSIIFHFHLSTMIATSPTKHLSIS